MRHPNDKGPNFRDESGQLYLVRCFVCGARHGRENWAPAVASGECAWCGWSESATNGAQARTDDNLKSVFG